MGGWIGRHPKLIAPVAAILAAAGIFVAVVQGNGGSRPRSQGTTTPGVSSPPQAAPSSGTPTASTSPSAPRPRTSGVADDRPNLVLIVTDDQWTSSVEGMPAVQRLLGDHGVVFPNAFASTPLCCPARAGILTGRYAHHTGVYSNMAPHGGVTAFDDRSTLATWLQAAGYQTSLVGKYLNGYGNLPTPGVPPGWDDWHVTATEPGRFFDYDLIENGRRVHYGSASKDYLTDVLRDRATSFIDRVDGPFFLMFTPFAPHAPATPAPADAGSYASEPAYRPPSFNEPLAVDK
ncbi:MAG: sulfatase-like hydrolase/transferase, partial [Actinomycetota bacterium]